MAKNKDHRKINNVGVKYSKKMSLQILKELRNACICLVMNLVKNTGCENLHVCL